MKRWRDGILAGMFVAAFLGVAAVALVDRVPRQKIPAGPREELQFTFLVWSDQHVRDRADGARLMPAIQAMNAVAGLAYPKEIGGQVDRPAFVLGCGDFTDAPTPEAVRAYANVATRALTWPSFDLIGNHDEGDASEDAARRWIIARHGSLSYSFDYGGVHFLMVFSPFDSKHVIVPQALDFIRQDLAKVPQGRPVIFATHLSLHAIRNREDLIEAFGGANVILALGGHLHHRLCGRFGRLAFVQAPSPRVGSEFVVVRISGNKLLVVAYDYAKGRWSDDGPARLELEFGVRPDTHGAGLGDDLSRAGESSR